MKKENEISIESALSDLRKKYGEGVVMQETDVAKKVESIPSGCFAIDRMLGCGGLPKGRIIEVVGFESSGKSSLALFLISQLQKNDMKCVYIDAEHAFNSDFAEKLGVDIKKLYVSQPGSLEESFDTLRAFVSTNQISLIVVDSVAALVPKSEVEGEEMLKDSMAVQARLMNKALRILTGEVARSRTIVIFINHLRERIGVIYGDNKTSPGGRALKFYSSIRIEVRKGERILGKDDAQIGNVVNLVAVKNKVGFPWRKGSFELYYDKGVDEIADTLDTALEIGEVEKEGNTIMFDVIKLGAGRDKAIFYLRENDDVYKSLRSRVEDKLKV